MADPYATQGGDKFGAQGNDFWLKGGEQPGFVGSAAATPEATIATPATPVSLEQPVAANLEVKPQADGSVSIPLTPAAAPAPEVPTAAAPAAETWSAASTTPTAPTAPATPPWPTAEASAAPVAPPAWPTATEQATPTATTEVAPTVPSTPIDTAVDTTTAEAAPKDDASAAPAVDAGLPWLTQAPAAAEASPTETSTTETALQAPENEGSLEFDQAAYDQFIAEINAELPALHRKIARLETLRKLPKNRTQLTPSEEALVAAILEPSEKPVAKRTEEVGTNPEAPVGVN
jgi:hypothetical protein